MQKKIFLILICFMLVGCSSNEEIDIDYYKVNKDMNEIALNECVNYLDATEDFCKGIGVLTIDEKLLSFQEAMDNNLFTETQLEYLENHNIVIHSQMNPILYKILEFFWPLIRFIFSLL